MTDFIPGIELNKAYYWEAVRPILDRHFPRLPHTAALIGYGSDALGFDTPVSRDHLWGPRLDLFLTPEDYEGTRAAIFEALRQNLPVRFRGYSTHFGEPDPGDDGVRKLAEAEQGPVDPLIQFHTLATFWNESLGIGPDDNLEPADWLTLSEQQLLLLTAGSIYHDGLGLEEKRRRFQYYPHDVWLYILSAQWSLISQEEAFVGRTAQVGDELGSRLVAARQADRLAHLCFMMERRYAPYSKWFGTAFQRLDCYPQMGPLLEDALAAPGYPERERLLAAAYTLAAEMHNALGITPPLETRTRTYSGWHLLRDGVMDVTLDDPRNTRPHLVIFGGRFADAITAAIQDPAVRSLQPYIGAANQFLVESSDALQSTQFRRSLRENLLNVNKK